MVIWSASKGAVAMGPVSQTPTDATDISWSANGEFLAWEQIPVVSSAHPVMKIFELNVLTHHTTTWSMNPEDSGYFSALVPGPTGVVGAALGAAQFTAFSVNGTRRRFNVAVPAIAAFSSYGAGFLATEAMFASYDPTATASPIVRVATNGGVTSTAANLPVFPANYSGPEYGIAAASSNGEDLAVELGDHTDVCGVGPSSVITTANAITGKIETLGPPTPTGGSVLRVLSMSWSPNGVLDATMYRCGSPDTGGNLTLELWENSGSRWRRAGTDVLYAARGPKGILATVSGYLAEKGSEDGPSSTVAGPRKLSVGGKGIALHAPAGEIAWAP
jgi:WD40 repeat protein